MKFEIGSWRIWELWEAEIPLYKAHIKRFINKPSGHTFMNLLVEFYREFAYTLGHITPVIILLLLIF